jgi:hypothetical protein
LSACTGSADTRDDCAAASRSSGITWPCLSFNDRARGVGVRVRVLDKPMGGAGGRLDALTPDGLLRVAERDPCAAPMRSDLVGVLVGVRVRVMDLDGVMDRVIDDVGVSLDDSDRDGVLEGDADELGEGQVTPAAVHE